MISWASTWLALMCVYESIRHKAKATIDINLTELEYLASHLQQYECVELVAALHYKSYELPTRLDGALRQIYDDIPCLRQLLHWNNGRGEGRGRTHEFLERRLRQLGHATLANWLGRTTFREIGKDLLDSVEEPFGELAGIQETSTAWNPFGTEITEISTSITTEDGIDINHMSLWVPIEMIVMILCAALIFTMIVVVGLLIIDRIARCRNESEEISIDKTDEENEQLLND